MAERLILYKKDADRINEYLSKLLSRLENERAELRKDMKTPESMMNLYIKMVVEIEELQEKLKEADYWD